MNYNIEPMRPEHSAAVLEICNHYVQSGFDTYYTDPLHAPFFNALVEALQDYPAIVITTKDKQEVVGVSFLRSYHPSPAFKLTAELRYFLAPGYTHKGLGKRLLNEMIKAARDKGISHLVVTVSSLSESDSLEFHKKNGFEVCGRLNGIGRKFDQPFDVIYLQRDI